MSRRFLMRHKILALGQDFWVKDEAGNEVFYVDNKLLALRKTYFIRDANNHELLKIQHKLLHIHRTMDIEQDGKLIASVQKNLISLLRDSWTIAVPGGDEMTAHGDFLDHEYEIQQHGATLAHISKQWFALRESYGIEVFEGANSPLMIAIAIAIEDMMDAIHAEQEANRSSAKPDQSAQ